MASGAVERFLSSMVMDFDMWHDGTGYDLSAIDEMTPEEGEWVVGHLQQKGVSDWRDLEALDRIGTPAAFALILLARRGSEASVRLAAQRYGPAADTSALEDEIVAGLASNNSSLASKALDQAAELGTLKVKAALFRAVRTAGTPTGYSAAATLFYLYGKMDSPHGFENRSLFLKFSEEPSPERDAAFAEFCAKLGVDPETAQTAP